MKKLILSLALVTGLAVTAQVQSQNNTDANSAVTSKKASKKNLSPEEKAKHQAEKAEKELTLTAEQKTKWQSASLERINANEPMREKMKGSTTPEDRKALRSQAKANDDKFVATVIAFLTPDQKTKFEQLKKDMKAKHKEHGKGKMH